MMNKIMICGATGMVGNRLASLLHENGHQLVVVGRNLDKIRKTFPFEVEALTWKNLPDCDAAGIEAIINLSGAGVSDEKWTDAYKVLMRKSRIETTQQCVDLSKRNPKIRLINASAVSAYGFYDQDHRSFTENDRDKRTGNNFLQQLIDDWETEALKAEATGNPVVLLRLGVVMDRSGKALPAMAQPFSFYMGGPAGTGKQVFSWISIPDVINAIAFLLKHPEITGPVNLVSPGACRQEEFAKALGKALGKPSFMPSPPFLIRMMMGQMGDELMLTGQRVVPEKLQQAGFVFQDTKISDFLQKQFQ